MATREVYIGQRRSYGGALCTVRYQGPLPGLKGEWIGVEWDDPTRGKHDGQQEGIRLFECLSPSPTAASFIRPSRTPDSERTVLEAIKFKYAPKQPSPSANGARGSAEAIAISGKVVEEVGFDRIQAQLSVLADLKIVLVDELVVSGVARRGASSDEIRAAQEELASTCPNLVELDVGWNAIETWADVGDICAPLKKLKILKASGLRLRSFKAQVSPSDGAENPFRNIEELHLGECLLSPEQIVQILSPSSGGGGGESTAFPNLKTLVLSSNNLHFFVKGKGPEGRTPSVTTVVLDNNKFEDLSSLPNLVALFPNMSSLSLQGNSISKFNLDGLRGSDSIRFETLETLNLARNDIPGYDFVDGLPGLFPNLTNLRISRNPLYESAVHGEERDEQDLEQRRHSRTVDSTNYYLTLARVPGLKSLNYTTITDRDREEGEIYYLSVTEKEIIPLLEASGDERHAARSAEDVEQRARKARRAYPLYTSLCAKYDREDVIARFVEERIQAERRGRDGASKAKGQVSELDSYAPGTLGSRLVEAHFYIPLPFASSSTITSESGATKSQWVPQKTAYQRFLPTTISVYRLKALLAKQFGMPALQFRLVYESHEYDPVEPISRTTRQDGIAGKNWDTWGDWDVDDVQSGGGGGEEESAGHDDVMNESNNDAAQLSPSAFIVRQGQRFKKRETEILDGMRAWGDFLDLTAADGSRRRDVRVRVEPQLR
ncbi:hypothetical protein PV08_08138 [Exophiala spinifera]|uniref:CAP-Gly domain-containing protein n=1 Tax=Exophiala spinifera TaxID=91928 RepID=A0A0D1YDB8_9EURO|nr:uncharacterized protein PV08_08138 [Exophiala spinifera]KIW12951.1 hypothetical protein PV08_08138 [Exophiala spinifera]